MSDYKAMEKMISNELNKDCFRLFQVICWKIVMNQMKKTLTSC